MSYLVSWRVYRRVTWSHGACTGVVPGLVVRVQVSVYRCSTWSRGACTDECVQV